MFGIDDKDAKQLERQLVGIRDKALPFATRATLNRAAFETQKTAKQNVREKMVTRNKFTEQSIRVIPDKRELNIRKQQATVGSIAGYMEDQEFGTVESKKGKHGVAIPTSEASGEGQAARPRKRLVRKGNKLSNIKITKMRRQAKTRNQLTVFKVQDAVTTGRRFVFLNLSRSKGIFKVVGGRKKFKRGFPAGVKLKMIHDLSRTSVVIPSRPWLKPAVDDISPRMSDYYSISLLFQLKRLGAR